MPEELEQGAEPQEVELQETPEQEVAEAPPAKVDNRVPYDRFQEVNEAKNRAEAYAQQLQLMILQAQQQAKAPVVPEPTPDPDVEAVVKPVLKKYLAPYEAEIQRLQQTNLALAGKAEAEAAVQYVRQNVPDIDDLMPDINAWVSSQSAVMQQKIRQDPDGVIMVANLVRAERAASGKGNTSTARQSMKSRARTEHGATSPNPTSTENVDWEKMDSKTFQETIKKLGIKI